MLNLLRTLLALLTVLSFSGEVVEAAVPGYDHHQGHEDRAEDDSGESNHRHAQHPVHACGVCHHAMPAKTGAPHLSAPAGRVSYRLSHESGTGRAQAPPYQPPIA
ncbi:hypothetical protein MACH15_00270 [Maricaulis maris]|nr:hypothetical protein MACH15_00270 [Maricaulis maris]